jgi:hypothetical protein
MTPPSPTPPTPLTQRVAEFILIVAFILATTMVLNILRVRRRIYIFLVMHNVIKLKADHKTVGGQLGTKYKTL